MGSAEPFHRFTREYLIVSQKEPRIEVFLRQQDGRWVLNEADGLQSSLDIPSLGVTLSLTEVFANVNFVPGPMRAYSA